MTSKALLHPPAGLTFECVNGEVVANFTAPAGEGLTPGETVRVWMTPAAVCRLRKELKRATMLAAYGYAGDKR